MTPRFVGRLFRNVEKPVQYDPRDLAMSLDDFCKKYGVRYESIFAPPPR